MASSDDERPGTAGGWAVVDAAVAAARDVLGDLLVAAYAVGSLAHGGFSEDVSDVDVAVIVEECDEAIPPAAAQIAARTRATLGPGLSDRLSLFYADTATFAAPPPTARFPAIDRRDLVAFGVLVHGADVAPTLPHPSRDELIGDTAAFAAARLSSPQTIDRINDPDRLVASGRRELTKTILFPIRFLATAHGDDEIGSNDEAVAAYLRRGGAHAPLATQALSWRTEPIADSAAAAKLVAAHLPGLVAEVLAAYAAIIPPATVSFVASSIRMNAPVTRLRE
jgi:hypothetical protein